MIVVIKSIPAVVRRMAERMASAALEGVDASPELHAGIARAFVPALLEKLEGDPTLEQEWEQTLRAAAPAPVSGQPKEQPS